MTALERAKRFVQKNAATTALVIVPLAMASSASAASIVFDPNGATATATLNSATIPTLPGGSDSFGSLLDGGVVYAGSRAFRMTAPAPNSGSGAFSITLTLSGGGSGLLNMASIPAHFDYGFSLVGATGSSFSYSDFASSVAFKINGYDVGTRTGGTSLMGALPLMPIPQETLTDWTVVLSADFIAFGGSADIVFSVPNIDIAPTGDQPDTAVPEPTSLLLLATGTALLLVTRRRRSSRR